MEVVVQQCTTDNSLLTFATNCLRPHKSKQHVSFWLRVTLLFIDFGHADALSESAVSIVLAGALAALADGAHRQLQTAAYMIVTKLFCRAQPSAELWTSVVDLVAKNADATDSQAALLCLVGLHQSSATYEMSKSAFNYVVKFDRLPLQLNAIAEMYDVAPFLRHFLSLLVSNALNRNAHCARIAQELATTLRAIEPHAAGLVKQLLHSADQCADDSVQPFVEQLMRTLASRCAEAVDRTVNEHWNSAAAQQQRKRKGVADLPFYLSVFDGTRHHFVRSANCTLHLGLNHASAAVRLLALQFLAEPTAPALESEYLHAVLVDRLNDEDGGVVTAAIAHIKSLLRTELSCTASFDRPSLLSACMSVIGGASDTLFEHAASSVHPVKVRAAALELLLLAFGTDAELGALALGYTLRLLMPTVADHKWAAKAAGVAAASGLPLFQDLPDLSAILSIQTSQTQKKEPASMTTQCSEAALATAAQIATNLLTRDALIVDALISALARMQPSTMLLLVLHEYCRLADSGAAKKRAKSAKRNGKVYELLLAMIHMTISTHKEMCQKLAGTTEMVETGKAVAITNGQLSAVLTRGSSAAPGTELILQMLSNCVHFATVHEVAPLYRYLMLVSAATSVQVAQPLIQSFVSLHIRHAAIDMLDFSSGFAIGTSLAAADRCIAVQSLYMCAAYIAACAKPASNELPAWQSICSLFIKLLASVSSTIPVA